MGGVALIGLPSLGTRASGPRLQRILQSPNWVNDEFANPEPTIQLREGVSMTKLMAKFFFKPSDTRPPGRIPSVKTDLSVMDDHDQPVITWFGHSSYLISFREQKILIDPVFSGFASPFSTFGKAFPGSNEYSAADFDRVDLLILTHDHYDHLDYGVMNALKYKAKRVVTSLGVGAHLEYWGFDPGTITELDWWESTRIENDLEVTAAPGRHFSGRSFKSRQTLWSAFVLQWPGFRIFCGGDSGYGAHFAKIGERFGPFDLVILETGQYNEDWPQIHMLPEQWSLACDDLRAKAFLPVHWGKFALSMHAWNEPPRTCVESFRRSSVRLAMPMIGQPIRVGIDFPTEPWWEL